jgi:4-amino-4-deoxy-L-arabinose transferase-like glycosyltransferase
MKKKKKAKKEGYDLSGLVDLLVKNKYLVLLIFISILVNSFYFQADSFWPDESLYMWLAQDFSRGFYETASLSSYVPVFTMSLLFPFFGSVLSGKITELIFSLIGVVFTYLIGKELFGEIYGFFASLLLILNPYYLFLGTRVLLDVPYTAIQIMAVYFLIRFEKERSTVNAILAGVAWGLPSFIKVSGFLTAPILMAYFLIQYNKKILDILKDKKILLFLGVYLCLNLLIIGVNIMLFRDLLPRLAGGVYMGQYIFGGGWNYYLLLFPDFFSVGPLLIFFFGVLLAAANFKKRENKVLLISFLVILMFYSLLIGEKVPRYVLSIFPMVFLLMAYGLSMIKYKDFKIEYLFMLLIIFFSYQYLSASNALMTSTGSAYLGFPEAGAWVANFANNDDVIYFGSYRSMRLFSGFNLVENGGNALLLPDNFSQFSQDVNTSNKTTILVIDAWEYTQPSWAYPLDEEKYNNLVSLGFTPYYVVEREVPTSSGTQKGWSVIILVRNPEATQ